MTDHHRPPSWLRRFVTAALVLCIIALTVLAAVIIIAPKVINSGEVRSRIENVIARELNGTAAFDSATLSLFPRPDVVLHGLAVEIPGTLSARAASIHVRARLFPLIQGRFSVSSVALERPELTFSLPGGGTGRERRRKAPAQPPSEKLDQAFAVAGRELPDLALALSNGRIRLVRDGSTVLTLGSLYATIAFLPQESEGPPGPPFSITGSGRATVSGTTALPAPLTVSIGRFDATPARLTFSDGRARLLDLDAAISGTLEGFPSGLSRSDLSARGSIGPDALAWLQTIFRFPDDLRLRPAIEISGARLRTSGTGSETSRSLAMTARNERGTSLTLALRLAPGLFSIDSLRVKDRESDADIRYCRKAADISASFKGTLTSATVEKVLAGGRFKDAWISGDLTADAPGGRWSAAALTGTLEGGGIVLSSPTATPVTADRFSIAADGNAVQIGPSVMSVGTDTLHVTGAAAPSASGVALDLAVTARQLTLSTIRTLSERKADKGPATLEGTSSPQVSGRVGLRAEALVLDSFRAVDLDSTITFHGNTVAASLDRSEVCGITVSGSVKAGDGGLEIDLAAQAHGRKLEDTLPCILHRDLRISGSFDLSGQVAGRGVPDKLLGSLGGSVTLSAAQGRIQSDNVVKGVIAYLNSTSLLKGSHADLLRDGVPYERVLLRGSLRDGMFSLSEAVIRSRDLHLAAEGMIGLRDGSLSLNVLAAPFTQLDRLLGSVPLVKYIVGNALIVVPAKVEGTFAKPVVRPLPVSAVGKNVTSLMKNAVQAPMKVIDPVIPESLERKRGQPQEQSSASPSEKNKGAAPSGAAP